MDVFDVIKNFDLYLQENNQEFEAVIIGGAALTLQKVITRSTNDIDVIVPSNLPDSVHQLSKAFAKKYFLPEEWLNCGPASVKDYLPKGWEQRSRKIYEGKNLIFLTLGRLELLMTKCWAYCDRSRDLQDILSLGPNKIELQIVREWLKPLDAHEGWPSYVDKIMDDLEKRLDVL